MAQQTKHFMRAPLSWSRKLGGWEADLYLSDCTVVTYRIYKASGGHYDVLDNGSLGVVSWATLDLAMEQAQREADGRQDAVDRRAQVLKAAEAEAEVEGNVATIRRLREQVTYLEERVITLNGRITRLRQIVAEK